MQSCTRKEVSFVKEGATVTPVVGVSVIVGEGVSVGGLDVDVSACPRFVGVAVASRVNVRVGTGEGLSVDVGVGETGTTGAQDLKISAKSKIILSTRPPQMAYLYLSSAGGNSGFFASAVVCTRSPV